MYTATYFQLTQLSLCLKKPVCHLEALDENLSIVHNSIIRICISRMWLTMINIKI